MGCGFTAMLIDQGEGSYSSISLVRAVKVKRALAFSGQFVCQAQMWVLCSSLVNSKILLFFFLGFLFVFLFFPLTYNEYINIGHHPVPCYLFLTLANW